MTRAVVFDFDGVLADTETMHLAAFQDVFRGRGWTLDRATYFDRYLGYDDRDLVETFARDSGFVLAAADLRHIVEEKTRRYEQRLIDGRVTYPTAAAAIARLGSRYHLAIASGSLVAEITAILRPAGLDTAFGAIVGADSVARSKPAPDAYAAAVEQLGVRPEAPLAIEDSRWGLASARLAGLSTIAITTSYAAHALPGADTIVDSLDEVTIDLVDRLIDARLATLARAGTPGQA